MIIISVGNFGRGWDNSLCDEAHIADALEELGHTVHRFQREDSREAYWKLPKADFALIQQWDQYGEDLITRLRMFADKIVVWSFDFQEWGQEWHERLVAEADLYLSKRIADSKYPNWQWLSQDFAPSFLGKAPTVEKDIDVLFTGSYLSWATERNKIINSISNLYGKRFVVHSVNDWPEIEQQPPIMDERLPELYARAKIVVAIDHTIEAGYWSDRAAQAMCCGAFVLHRYVPMLESRLHNNVAYFKSVGDCMGQLGYFLEQKEHREMIADKGYEYAQKELKVRTRVQDLLTIVDNVL